MKALSLENKLNSQELANSSIEEKKLMQDIAKISNVVSGKIKSLGLKKGISALWREAKSLDINPDQVEKIVRQDQEKIYTELINNLTTNIKSEIASESLSPEEFESVLQDTIFALVKEFELVENASFTIDGRTMDLNTENIWYELKSAENFDLSDPDKCLKNLNKSKTFRKIVEAIFTQRKIIQDALLAFQNNVKEFCVATDFDRSKVDMIMQYGLTGILNYVAHVYNYGYFNQWLGSGDVGNDVFNAWTLYFKNLQIGTQQMVNMNLNEAMNTLTPHLAAVPIPLIAFLTANWLLNSERFNLAEGKKLRVVRNAIMSFLLAVSIPMLTDVSSLAQIFGRDKHDQKIRKGSISMHTGKKSKEYKLKDKTIVKDSWLLDNIVTPVSKYEQSLADAMYQEGFNYVKDEVSGGLHENPEGFGPRASEKTAAVINLLGGIQEFVKDMPNNQEARVHDPYFVRQNLDKFVDALYLKTSYSKEVSASAENQEAVDAVLSPESIKLMFRKGIKYPNYKTLGKLYDSPKSILKQALILEKSIAEIYQKEYTEKIADYLDQLESDLEKKNEATSFFGAIKKFFWNTESLNISLSDIKKNQKEYQDLVETMKSQIESTRESMLGQIHTTIASLIKNDLLDLESHKFRELRNIQNAEQRNQITEKWELKKQKIQELPDKIMAKIGDKLQKLDPEYVDFKIESFNIHDFFIYMFEELDLGDLEIPPSMILLLITIVFSGFINWADFGINYLRLKQKISPQARKKSDMAIKHLSNIKVELEKFRANMFSSIEKSDDTSKPDTLRYLEVRQEERNMLKKFKKLKSENPTFFVEDNNIMNFSQEDKLLAELRIAEYDNYELIKINPGETLIIKPEKDTVMQIFREPSSGEVYLHKVKNQYMSEKMLEAYETINIICGTNAVSTDKVICLDEKDADHIILTTKGIFLEKSDHLVPVSYASTVNRLLKAA